MSEQCEALNYNSCAGKQREMQRGKKRAFLSTVTKYWNNLADVDTMAAQAIDRKGTALYVFIYNSLSIFDFPPTLPAHAAFVKYLYTIIQSI